MYNLMSKVFTITWVSADRKKEVERNKGRMEQDFVLCCGTQTYLQAKYCHGTDIEKEQ